MSAKPVRDAEGKKTYRKLAALILTFFIEWGLKIIPQTNVILLHFYSLYRIVKIVLTLRKVIRQFILYEFGYTRPFPWDFDIQEHTCRHFSF